MNLDALPPWPDVRGAGLGGGGNGCFAAGTLIATDSGVSTIESLVQGDTVIAFDYKGALHPSRVLETFSHPDEELFEFEIWGGGKLRATLNHWVLNQYGAFVEIGTLCIGEDMLVDERGHLRPIIQRKSIGRHTVHNLTVEPYHTFIANSIRVHNGGLGPARITGSGMGGAPKKPAGGSGRSPIVADDNLNSTQYARVLLLLGEGEQEGYPSAKDYEKGTDEYETAMLKDIFINGTPILKANADVENPKESDYNYQGIEIAHTDGTPWQTYLGGFNPIETQKQVGLTVTKDTPVTRTIRDDTVDSVRVTLQWPALQQVYKPGKKLPRDVVKQAYQGKEKPMEGDLVGSTMEYEIQTASAGGSFKRVLKQKISGRTGDAYLKSHEVPIKGPFPVDIRVVRLTADSNNEQVQNTMIWLDYTEVIYAKLSYPYSSLLGLEIDAKYFNSWPQVSVRKRGVKVPIPDNASVDKNTGRLICQGIWTGNFAPMQWTTDPAWILHEAISNCRWGFGQHCSPKSLDRWSFYRASQYCSELVPDGKGGKEPRFSCNVNLQNSTEAYELINQLASVFRAMPYWGEGLVTLVQDAPATPLLTISNADVTPEGFRYAGASLRAKHTVAIIKFFDNERQDFDYEVVENKQYVELFGSITTNIDAFACTSRGQARRLGEWLLYVEQYESEVITVETTLAVGAELRPGHIFNAADLLKTGVRRGGKIRGGSTTQNILIDQAELDITLGENATITAKLLDGSHEIRTISSVQGGSIGVALPFSSAPLTGGTWSVSNNLMKVTEWRCLNVVERNRTNYLITGVRHLKGKYDFIEREITLDTEVYAPLQGRPPAAPSRIAAATSRNATNGSMELNVSWPSVPEAAAYEVSYRRK